MEVHTHSHTSRKKWTHYFWEFLMLFLAVFCGFLAENFREHQVEHQRAVKYMRSMLEDLKSDTAMLNKNLVLRQGRIAMIDTLVKLMNTPDRDKYGNDIYFLARSISPPTNIFPNDGTIQQLKSSGNLRLINNTGISNSIMAYDQKARNVLFEMGDEVDIRGEYRQIAIKVFRGNIFHDLLASDTVSKPTNNPTLFTSDPVLINNFIGQAQYFKRVHQAQLNLSKRLLAQAKQLIADIKKEYHLE